MVRRLQATPPARHPGSAPVAWPTKCRSCLEGQECQQLFEFFPNDGRCRSSVHNDDIRRQAPMVMRFKSEFTEKGAATKLLAGVKAKVIVCADGDPSG